MVAICRLLSPQKRLYINVSCLQPLRLPVMVWSLSHVGNMYTNHITALELASNMQQTSSGVGIPGKEGNYLETHSPCLQCISSPAEQIALKERADQGATPNKKRLSRRVILA